MSTVRGKWKNINYSSARAIRRKVHINRNLATGVFDDRATGPCGRNP